MSIQTAIVYVLFAHWMGDFVLQSDRMAKGKSKSNRILAEHVGVYTAVLLVATLNPWYAVLNGLIHYPVDWVTSRINSRMWARGRTHDFFVGVGFDQLIHATCLIGTMGILG